MATHADTLAAGAVGGREGQFVLVEWVRSGRPYQLRAAFAAIFREHASELL
jgi:hypothetical protein